MLKKTAAERQFSIFHPELYADDVHIAIHLEIIHCSLRHGHWHCHYYWFHAKIDAKTHRIKQNVKNQIKQQFLRIIAAFIMADFMRKSKQ